jgi:hypothetical protein
MVELIGVGTMVALSWVLAVCMANEIDSEKRRPTGFGRHEAERGHPVTGLQRDAA